MISEVTSMALAELVTVTDASPLSSVLMELPLRLPLAVVKPTAVPVTGFPSVSVIVAVIVEVA